MRSLASLCRRSAFGVRSPTPGQATSILFASTFFLSRVVWLPLGLLEIAVNHRPKWKGLGIFRTGLIPVTGLQFYWFYRIVLMLTRK